MPTLVKLLVVFVLLLVTNVGTFLFFTWRCRQELRGEARLRESLRERNVELEAEVAESRQELERLSVWGHFIRLQQELNGVDREIDRLNFGNALQRLDVVGEEIERGGYGDALQERRASLQPVLEATQQALRRTQVDTARRRLAELNERAFAVLSGIAPPEEPTEPDERPEAPPELVPGRSEAPPGPEREPTVEPPPQQSQQPPPHPPSAGGLFEGVL